MNETKVNAADIPDAGRDADRDAGRSDFQTLLHRVAAGERLSAEACESAFERIMEGSVPETQLSAFLTALHVRGESPEELLGAVRAVRGRMKRVDGADENALDVCGTGGDGLGTLNVSTATAFVLAGLGVQVAKHGGRALSSRAGATDVLERLGIPADPDMARQEKRLRQEKLAFLAAPYHHPAMKRAGPVRKALGFRTLFNLLGPLCNPAGVRRQLVGVFAQNWRDPVADALEQLGSQCVWVACGETDEGEIDELTLAGPSYVSVRENGLRLVLRLTPEMAGLPARPVAELRGGTPAENALRLEALLNGEKGCYRDTVVFNAAIGLHIAGRGNVLADGAVSPHALRRNVALAGQSLESGLAREALVRARSGSVTL